MRAPRPLFALLLAAGIALIPGCAAHSVAKEAAYLAPRTLPVTLGSDSRAIVVDADADDLPDIYVTHAAGGKDVLLRQRAADDWEAHALDDAPPAHAALALDLNRDFHADIVLARATGLALLLGDGQGGFRDATPPEWRQPLAAPVHVDGGDVDKDGWMDLYVRQAGGATLWRHTGTLADGTPRFMDATAELGLTATAGAGASILFDADDDGDLDLALAAATLVIMENDGHGRFTRRDTGIAGPWAHLSVADDDHDGRLDILLSRDEPGGPAPAWARNGGALRFSAEPVRDDAGDAFALRAMNLDNDTEVDLLQTGGPLRSWSAGSDSGWPGASRLLATTDVDRDGFTDLLLAGSDGHLRVQKRRRNTHHWLGVRLRGQENGAITGARVVVYLRDGRAITRQYLAGDDELRFGLGRRSAVGGVRIYWPSGRYTQIEALDIDRHLGFVEPTAASGGRHVRLSESWLGVQRYTRKNLSCR